MSEIATGNTFAEMLAGARQLILIRCFKTALERLKLVQQEHLEGLDLSQQGDLAYALGVCCNGMELPAEALIHCNRSHSLALQRDDRAAQARALEEIGGAHQQRGDFPRAQDFHERAHEMHRQLDDKPGRARALRNLGCVRGDMGQIAAASDAFRAARGLFGELGDTEGVAVCVNSLALQSAEHFGHQAAIDEYRQHLAMGDCSRFLVYNNLGFLLLLGEQLEEARASFQLGLADCQKRGVDDDNLGLLRLNLGILASLQARYADADQLYHQASEVFSRHGQGRAVQILLLPTVAQRDYQLGRYFVTDDGDKLALTLLNAAVSMANKGDLDLGLELVRKSVEMDRDQGYPLAVLGWVHIARRENQAASTAFSMALAREPGHELYKRSLDLVNPYADQKVGRNDPCPCGSGKKFKKCHGVGSAAPRSETSSTSAP